MMMTSRAVRAALCGLSFSLVFGVAEGFAAPPLRWNEPAGGVWDATTPNWLDAGDNAVAWIPGAEAVFEGAGGLIEIAADVSATNLTFTGNGYTLLGAGRLYVEGVLTAATATTNSIVADLCTAGGLTKSGAGALALARCAGLVSVQGGSLLAAGSLFVDAEIAVAADASLVTLGEPDSGANLIVNGSFETPALSSGGWSYSVPSGWTVVYPNYVGRQNTKSVAGYNNPWNAAGTSPDGDQMMILQYGGTAAQTVTVPADGLYSIAFSYLMRSDNRETQVYLTLDGIPFATFLNRSPQTAPGRFVSGALWLTAGSHTLGIGGEHGWGDRSTMVDLVCFAAPSSAQPCRALGGDSVLKVVDAANVVMEHTGTTPIAYVAINGTAASGTFNASHASGVFSGSGSLACATPANIYAWSGVGSWSDATHWADGVAPVAGGGRDLLVRFPSATGVASANDLAGEFLARGLAASGIAADGVATFSGGTVVLTNSSSGAAPKISLQAPGTWTVTAPVEARHTLTLDVAGQLTFQENPLGVASNGTFYKTGSGTVTLPTFTNRVASAIVYDGAIQTPQLPSSLTVNLFSQRGRAAALCLTQGGLTFGNTINLLGSGTPIFATRCGGTTLTCSNWTYGYGDTALFDVGVGDTLSLQQMLLINNSRGYSATALVKAGPGTLEIRSAGADTDKNRAYRGRTTLRNGTLVLAEDDWGTLANWSNPFNGRTYAGTGGSLGYNLLTNAVLIGDSGTAPSDALALIAAGDGRWIGHDIEVANAGASVTLGMTAGSAMFAGTLTLHRNIVFSGPADGILTLNSVCLAPDFTGTFAPAFSGLAALRIEGDFPSTASLALRGRALRFATGIVRDQTLASLALGDPDAPAALDVDFGAGVNDILRVTATDGLTLSNTVVNLFYAGTGQPFAEPGTYTLFTYQGTLDGDAALLSVGNPQDGASYAFANDTANRRVTLTITGTSGGIAAVWIHPEGGAWAVGANWDGGTAPNGAGLVPLFGLAITNHATIDTGAGYTVGGLTFNNAAYGYTLGGSGGLTFADAGDPSTVSVSAGAHTLNTALNAPDGLNVTTADDAQLALGPDATVAAALTLAQGTLELQGNATLDGAVDLADATMLRVRATTNAAIGTLSGASSSVVALTGDAPALTINQAADATFAGSFTGGTDARVTKTGSGTLGLSGPLSSLAGRVALQSGTIETHSAALAAAADLAAAGTLRVAAPVANGLSGFFYDVTPVTNAFRTLAEMESHFASLTPAYAALSGANNETFDFGMGTPYAIAGPYASDGSRAFNFETVWRGTITVPDSGTYVFGVQCDDGVLLAIDGQQVLARNYYVNTWIDGAITLDAGRHDIVIGYFQMSGGGGIRMRVRRPNQTTPIALPNAWLTPYSQVGALAGGGTVTLPTANAPLCAHVKAGGAQFGGTLSGVSGTWFAKSGNGLQSLAGGGVNGFAGDVDVQAGILAFDTDELVDHAARLSVRAGATLALAGTETVSALTGDGILAIGGHVYVVPFEGDADCGISADKTYTHLLDFPANGNPATINGVTFVAAGMSGSSGDYTWSTVNPPTGTWNDPPNDSTRTGIDRLLWDFIYGKDDFTTILSGLTPGKAYECRLYFRNFNNNPRRTTFTFTAGAHQVGELFYNPDSGVKGSRSWMGCRYTADASGSLAIRVVSHVSTDRCHFYGLSNEELPSTAAPTLIVAPAAAAEARFTGNVTGLGTLVKDGDGTQRFGGTIALPAPLTVQAGTAVLEQNANLPGGAAIAAGATLKAPLGGVTLGAISGEGTFELTGTADYAITNGPHFVKITGDADSGISRDKRYTHLLDFGSSTALATVNGVTFNKERPANGPLCGYSWTNAPATLSHSGGNKDNIGIPSSEDIYNLLYDFCYGGPYAPSVFALTGLTTGKWYEVRFYHRKWEANQTRNTTFTFDPDGAGPISDAISFNPDSPAGAFNDNYLAYRYFALTDRLEITITCPTTHKYHLYGLSNEEVPDALGAATLALADDCVFSGTVTGSGSLIKSGAGALTVTGVGDATGALTVSGGACGVAEGGRITTGPVNVLAGATLFGHGQMGGPVNVASNAWLQGGTAAACGTLAVGGDLTLAPGASIAWRYADGGTSDTITVAGTANVPTNGLVQVASLTPGLMPPAKRPLISSSTAINGPDDLSGWTVEGVENASLRYSDDRTKIYFFTPRGSLLLLQ
ncbi:MAG: PA14 domain-containing protein [Kiritimatiellae bacterium]|nr:PA14 domain-containing protein [Kiritimatiellia bacterium]